MPGGAPYKHRCCPHLVQDDGILERGIHAVAGAGRDLHKAHGGTLLVSASGEIHMAKCAAVAVPWYGPKAAGSPPPAHPVAGISQEQA